jgi:hypothetical protein
MSEEDIRAHVLDKVPNVKADSLRKALDRTRTA